MSLQGVSRLGPNWDRFYARRVSTLRASDIREAFKLAERSDIISFAGGFPGPETFPLDAVADTAARVVREEGRSSLQYGPTEGLYEMRSFVAEKMAALGMDVDPEQVLITNGSQQALDLIGRIFLDPDDPVFVEQPTYVGALSALRPSEAALHGVPMDDDGLIVEALEEELARPLRKGRKTKLLYTVPTFHNPMGVCLSVERRHRLLKVAEQHDLLIVEDDPYGELRFEGVQLPTIGSFDPGGRVLYLGSFSKVVFPGLRLGWVVSDEPVIRKLAMAKQGTDLCSNTFGQRLIVACHQDGLLAPHLARLCDVYREKRDCMLAALNDHFPPTVKWTYPLGGFFVWITLPEGMDARALLPEAVRHERVAYVSGDACFMDGRGRHTIRLSYSQPSLDEIQEGIRRLGRFFAGHIQTKGTVAQSPVSGRSAPNAAT